MALPSRTTTCLRRARSDIFPCSAGKPPFEYPTVAVSPLLLQQPPLHQPRKSSWSALSRTQSDIAPASNRARNIVSTPNLHFCGFARSLYACPLSGALAEIDVEEPLKHGKCVIDNPEARRRSEGTPDDINSEVAVTNSMVDNQIPQNAESKDFNNKTMISNYNLRTRRINAERREQTDKATNRELDQLRMQTLREELQSTGPRLVLKCINTELHRLDQAILKLSFTKRRRFGPRVAALNFSIGKLHRDCNSGCKDPSMFLLRVSVVLNKLQTLRSELTRAKLRQSHDDELILRSHICDRGAILVHEQGIKHVNSVSNATQTTNYDQHDNHKAQMERTMLYLMKISMADRILCRTLCCTRAQAPSVRHSKT